MYIFKGFIKIKALLSDGQQADVWTEATYRTSNNYDVEDIKSMDLSELYIINNKNFDVDESERDVYEGTYIDDWTELLGHNFEYYDYEFNPN